MALYLETFLSVVMVSVFARLWLESHKVQARVWNVPRNGFSLKAKNFEIRYKMFSWAILTFIFLGMTIKFSYELLSQA